MPYTKLHTWYKMVTAYSVTFSSVSCKIFPSNTGEPSRSTFDAQNLLFGLRSRHDGGNTIISFVLLSIRTIWAAKHRTNVHHYAKTSSWPFTRSSGTYDLMLVHQFAKSREVTSLLKWIYSPTSASGIIILLKTTQEIGQIFSAFNDFICIQLQCKRKIF